MSTYNMFLWRNKENIDMFSRFVCAEVLLPSQPNGVMFT